MITVNDFAAFTKSGNYSTAVNFGGAQYTTATASSLRSKTLRIFEEGKSALREGDVLNFPTFFDEKGELVENAGIQMSANGKIAVPALLTRGAESRYIVFRMSWLTAYTNSGYDREMDATAKASATKHPNCHEGQPAEDARHFSEVGFSLYDLVAWISGKSIKVEAMLDRYEERLDRKAAAETKKLADENKTQANQIWHDAFVGASVSKVHYIKWAYVENVEG